MMNILFLGGHELGKIVLEALIHAKKNIVGVYTTLTDDFWYSGVDEVAKKNNLIHLENANINSLEMIEKIRNLKPDLIVSVNFSQILKKEIISIPNKGCINIHASLLPDYRGRAPLNWALLNGEKEVGVTVHYIDVGTDTGNIIKQKSIAVDARYISEIMDDVKRIYPSIVLEVVNSIELDNVVSYEQHKPNKPYWRKRTSKDGLIDLKESGKSIMDLIRAVSKPYPGAYFMVNGEQLIIWKAKYISKSENTISVGTIIKVDPYLVIQLSDGLLEIESYSYGDELIIGQGIEYDIY